MFKFWNSLQPITRTIIIIAIIVLIALSIYWIRRGVKKSQQNQEFNKDYDILIQQGQKPTYLSTNYSTFADKIYEAGCESFFCSGTDEDSIYDVFDSMKNDVDVVLLQKAFGSREPRGGICVPGLGSCDYPLGQWLQTELSTEEFQEINNILSKKGITYKF